MRLLLSLFFSPFCERYISRFRAEHQGIPDEGPLRMNRPPDASSYPPALYDTKGSAP